MLFGVLSPVWTMHLGRSSGLRAKQYKERRIFTVDHLVSHDWLLLTNGESSTLDVRAEVSAGQ